MITTRAIVIRTSENLECDHGKGQIVYEGPSLEEAQNYIMRHQQDLNPGDHFDTYYRYEDDDPVSTYCGMFK